jgi:hypothetical protein
MLQKMKKVQVIGPKKDLQSVVDILYHTGTVQAKIKNFLRFDSAYPTEKGILHEKTIMFGLALLFIGIGGGILIHYISDFG